MTWDTSQSPIASYSPAVESPTGDSSMHALTALSRSFLFFGENDPNRIFARAPLGVLGGVLGGLSPLLGGVLPAQIVVCCWSHSGELMGRVEGYHVGV